MNTHTEKLKIPESDVAEYQSLMDEGFDYGERGVAKYATVKNWTVKFPDGLEMDVKVCSSNDGDPLWSEAVLFENGSERGCTEAQDELLGEYSVERPDGTVYTVEVVAESDAEETESRFVAVVRASAVRDAQIAKTADADLADDDAWYDYPTAEVFLGVLNGTYDDVLSYAAHFADTEKDNIRLIPIDENNDATNA